MRLRWENKDLLSKVTDGLEVVEFVDQAGPPVPEMLGILRTMRALNMPYRDGGIEEQPALFFRELEITISEDLRFMKDLEDTVAAQKAWENAHPE